MGLPCGGVLRGGARCVMLSRQTVSVSCLVLAHHFSTQCHSTQAYACWLVVQEQASAVAKLWYSFLSVGPESCRASCRRLVSECLGTACPGAADVKCSERCARAVLHRVPNMQRPPLKKKS